MEGCFAIAYFSQNAARACITYVSPHSRHPLLLPVAVGTVAFGMGIDLPHVRWVVRDPQKVCSVRNSHCALSLFDCRYVVHWNLAKNPEAFYQGVNVS
jgi:hypothetical protein